MRNNRFYLFSLNITSRTKYISYKKWNPPFLKWAFYIPSLIIHTKALRDAQHMNSCFTQANWYLLFLIVRQNNGDRWEHLFLQLFLKLLSVNTFQKKRWEGKKVSDSLNYKGKSWPLNTRRHRGHIFGGALRWRPATQKGKVHNSERRLWARSSCDRLTSEF